MKTWGREKGSKGKPHSIETRRKIGEGVRRAYAKYALLRSREKLTEAVK